MILDYIAQYNNVKDVFLHGQCYAFACILRSKFNGELYYIPDEQHFVCKIDNKYYDANGEYNMSHRVYRWKMYRKRFPLEYNYVLHGIIIKD